LIQHRPRICLGKFKTTQISCTRHGHTHHSPQEKVIYSLREI